MIKLVAKESKIFYLCIPNQLTINSPKNLYYKKFSSSCCLYLIKESRAGMSYNT